MWTACDPKKQFFSPYAYSANPLSHIDFDGAYSWKQFWNDSKEFSKGLAWNIVGGGLLHFAPLSIDLILSLANNWKGITHGDFWSGAGKFITAAGAGYVQGVSDMLVMSGGKIPFVSAGVSSSAIGAAHNVAYDKNLFDKQAYSVSYKMTDKLYDYGTAGVAVKMGGDITWANHVANEDPILGNRYDEAKYRFAMMDAKINQTQFWVNGRMVMDYGAIDPSGNNDWNTRQGRINKIGHRTLGAIFGGELSYYGFEVWGEPYEQWNTDDYRDDFWTSQSHPGFSYWHEW